jgi:hypothetical protein
MVCTYLLLMCDLSIGCSFARSQKILCRVCVVPEAPEIADGTVLVFGAVARDKERKQDESKIAFRRSLLFERLIQSTQTKRNLQFTIRSQVRNISYVIAVRKTVEFPYAAILSMLAS